MLNLDPPALACEYLVGQVAGSLVLRAARLPPFRMPFKSAIVSFKLTACALIWVEALAVSSALAAFVCVTLSISATAVVT